MKIKVIALAAVALQVTLVAGCASTDLSSPVSGFDSAAQAAASSFSAYMDIEDAWVAQQQVTQLGTPNSTLQIVAQPNTCGKSSSSCRLEVVLPGGQHVPYGGVDSTKELRALMTEIVTYGDTLDLIAKAGTDASISEAADKAKAGTGSLASAVDTLAKKLGHASDLAASVATYGSPAEGTFDFLASLYVNEVRLQALRSATARAHVPFSQGISYLKEAAEAARGLSVAQAHSAYGRACNTLDTPQDRIPERLSACVKAAAQLNVALAAKPDTLLDALKKSHDALIADLNKEATDFSAMWAEVQNMVSEAKKVKDIVDQYKTAAAAPPSH
jgi:outer membrane murein-binding lipoprotein Lpp